MRYPRAISVMSLLGVESALFELEGLGCARDIPP